MVRTRKTAVLSAFLVLVPLCLASCTLESFVPEKGKGTDVVDRPQKLSREDYDNINDISSLLPEGAEATASVSGAPPIPDLAQVLAAPRPPKIGNAKLVTLSVTDDVPLRDVLFELGRLADVDIEVGSGLDTQGINLRATNRPFNEVIERISDLAYLRYSLTADAIRVERDTPFIKNYPLDFLNQVRSSNSSYQLSTTALSSGGGGGGGGGSSGGGSTSQSIGTSGSTASITGQSEGDLWSSLEASVTEILNYDPRGPQSAGEAAPTSGGGAAPGGATNFVVNRQVGLLSVNATERQHVMISRFLSLMTRNASSQVLIEAKIVEVSLTNQFQSGVDWNKILGSTDGISASVGTYTGGETASITGAGINLPKAPANTQSFTLGLNGLGLDTVVSMAEQYGTTRTLSSPRLSAMNNQQAVLTFARNRIFFNCTIEEGASTTVTDGGTSSTTAPSVDCPPSSVPIGIILTIMPSINMETQEVTLSVRPTLTRQVDTVQNPGVLIAAASYGIDVPADVPIIEVREIDSIMKVKSGGVMIIGGLMEDSARSAQMGVPGAMDMPLLGNFFKSRDETIGKNELIILIKATIVSSDGNIHPADRGLIHKFTTDPRPVF